MKKNKLVATLLLLSILSTTPVMAEGAWKKDSRGYWFENEDKSYPTNSWKKVGTKWYYFDSNGYMSTNWKKINEKWYYLKSSGEMASDEWVGNYYLTEDGSMVVSTVTKDGYTVDENGKWDSSIPKKDGKWILDGSKWWFKNPDGSYPKSAWEKIKEKWYYFDDEGYMKENSWVGKYYVGKDGAMLVSTTTPDGKMVDEKGKLIEKKSEISEKTEIIDITDEIEDNSIEKNTLYNVKNGWEKLALYIYEKDVKDNIESVKAKIFENITEKERESIFFGTPFLDENYILVVAPKNLLKNSKELKSDFPNTKEGVFVSNENNDLVLFEGKEGEAHSKDYNMVVFSGKLKYDYPFTAKYLVGLPKNESHFGVTALENTNVIAGINFKSDNTVLQSGSNYSAISLTRDDIDLTVEGNTFTFDGNKQAMSKAIVGYSVDGILKIKNNEFSGVNLDNVRSTQSYGMINFMQRSARKLDLQVEGNKFLNIGSTALNITVENKEKIQFTNNIVDGVLDDGIKISIFPNDFPQKNDITIKGNTIKNYGLGAYEGYSDGGAGQLAPSNDNEAGISINYISPTYGANVNDTWVSSTEELEKLLISENKIQEKTSNDKNENVVDSKEVLVGQKGRFLNVKERINEDKYGNSKHFFVLTKNENGSVTYGQNPENPTEEITVGGLYIVGDGTGVVTLPSTLKIKGDLIVNLPNGSISNHANVSGKVEIKAQSKILNDAKFALDVTEITRGESPENGIVISISEIKNDKGELVSKKDSNFKNIKIFLNGKLIESDKYTVNEEEDTISISKDFVNTLEKTANIVVRFSDDINKVSEISSNNLVLNILDRSEAKFEWNDLNLTHMNPENKEIRIRVKDLVDKNGNKVSKESSKLKVSFLYGSQKVEDRYLSVDDAKDEIILKAELLSGISASEYRNPLNRNIGTPVTYSIEVSDESNSIGNIRKDIRFNVEDSSFARFEFEKGLTFTQGEAPEKGIKLYVRDVLNTSGKSISKNQTKLVGNINIEPFPVNRDNTEDSEIIVLRDEKGNYIKEIFNPKYIIVNDEEDSVTFTREYLNRMKIQDDSSTESGVKIFTFKYKDEFGKVDMRSDKVALYIKKKEKERSKTTTIEFKEKTLKIENAQIVSNGLNLNEENTVSDILKNVIKYNPRQQVIVRTVDNIDKRSFDSIKVGDKLVVIAEDGVTKIEYKISISEIGKPDLIESVNNKIVLSYDDATIRVKSGTFVRDLISAIQAKEKVEFTVVGYTNGEEYEVTKDSNISLDHKIKATKDGKDYFWNVRLVSNVKKTRALLVGNYDYAGDKLDLIGPPTDLKMMERVFKGNRKFGSATEVSSHKNLTKKQFLEEIRQTFNAATDYDISYIYYSGHGNNIKDVSYICTVDDKVLADGSFDTTGWISVNELKAELDKIPGTKVLILDCCNAGGFIGKKAIDAISSSTPRHTRDTSVEFVENVENTFKEKKEMDVELNYLTDNEYKVLVASSANEYSYEDKKEGLGKFTKMFAIAAGLENSEMKGDKNSDRKLSLMESYNFLMENIASISHIQVFPYLDEFYLFEDVNITPLSSNAKITSTFYKVNIRVNKKGEHRGSITAKTGEVIDSELTVQEFLGKFKKGHENQVLSVVGSVGSEFIPLSNSDKLGERLLYLQVVAENGDVSRYPFSAKNKSTLVGGNTKISSNSRNVEVITSPIHAIKLKAKMTVSELLSHIVKGDEKQVLAVYPRGNTAKAKDNSSMVENLDYLLVTSPDGKIKTRYNISLMVNDGLKPDFAGAFIIDGNKIKSGTKKLNSNLTVKNFGDEITNMNKLVMEIDINRSGVYPKGSNYNSPFVMKKRQTDKLQNGDIFVIRPFNPMKQPVVFVLEVENPSNQGNGNNSTEVATPKWTWQFKLDGTFIVEDGDTLGSDKTFKYITDSLSNKGDYTKFEFFDKSGNIKKETDSIEDGARIKFYNGENSKEYTIKFNTTGIIIPPIIVD